MIKVIYNIITRMKVVRVYRSKTQTYLSDVISKYLDYLEIAHEVYQNDELSNHLEEKNRPSINFVTVPLGCLFVETDMNGPKQGRILFPVVLNQEEYNRCIINGKETEKELGKTNDGLDLLDAIKSLKNRESY